MHKLTVFFVLVGLLFIQKDLCRSEYTTQAALQFKNPLLDSCCRKNTLGKPQNNYEELHIRKKNVQLAAAIAAAAQYFAQQQSPGSDKAFPTPPADLVSIALACQQPRNGYHTIAEDRLAYGFTKIPVEDPCYKPQVPQAAKALEEANLYTMNGEVMELKPKKEDQKSLSSEAIDEFVGQVLKQFSSPSERLPTLSDLGYVPAKQI